MSEPAAACEWHRARTNSLPTEQMSEIENVERERNRDRGTAQADLNVMSTVIAAGFSTVSAVLALVLSQAILPVLVAFVPVAVFVVASHATFGSAAPEQTELGAGGD